MEDKVSETHHLRSVAGKKAADRRISTDDALPDLLGDLVREGIAKGCAILIEQFPPRRGIRRLGRAN